MPGIKLLVNGVAGAGKTDLLRTLDPKTTFVVSRDAKAFPLRLPHMMVETYYDASTLCYGSDKTVDGEKIHIEGITDKMEAFNTRFGFYPSTIVIDSVSQIFMDIIDKASQKPNVYGSQGAEINKEIAILTSFVHEYLEMNGIDVILLNHVVEEKADGKPTGVLEAFGSGKFLQKGGFYSTVNESITVYISGTHRMVHTREKDKCARTMLPDLPDKMYVENTVYPDKSKALKEDEIYFSLASHMEKLRANLSDLGEFSF
jgi:hypothetical protein